MRRKNSEEEDEGREEKEEEEEEEERMNHFKSPMVYTSHGFVCFETINQCTNGPVCVPVTNKLEP